MRLIASHYCIGYNHHYCPRPSGQYPGMHTLVIPCRYPDALYPTQVLRTHCATAPRLRQQPGLECAHAPGSSPVHTLHAHRREHFALPRPYCLTFRNPGRPCMSGMFHALCTPYRRGPQETQYFLSMTRSLTRLDNTTFILRACLHTYPLDTIMDITPRPGTRIALRPRALGLGQ